MERIDIDVAAALAEELLGTRPSHIEGFKPPSGGLESYSFRVRHGVHDLYLKVNHTPHTQLGVHFNRRIREAGLPAPELLAWHEGAGPDRLPCAVWQYVDGDQANWLAEKRCPYDEAHCGQLLRRLHEIPFDDGPYCFLGDGEPVSPLGPSSQRWADFFPCELAARRGRDLGWLDAGLAAVLADLPARLEPALQSPPKRLLHMDFLYNGNLIVEGGGTKIIAIVDGAEAMAGDPRLELATFDLGFPGSGWDFDMEAFRAGYGAEHDPTDELSRFYMVMLLLCGRFMERDLHVPMARRQVLLIRTLLQTFR